MNNKFELTREQLLEIKHRNVDMYKMICELSVSSTSYCDVLDVKKLKKECELGYFRIEDLFTKDQISKAYRDQQLSEDLEKVEKQFGCESRMIKHEYPPVELISRAVSVKKVVDVIGEMAFFHGDLIDAILDKKDFNINVTPEQSKLIDKICVALGVQQVGGGNGNFIYFENSRCGYGYKAYLFTSEKDFDYPEYSMETGKFVGGEA